MSHLDGTTVVEAAIGRDVGLPIDHAVFTAPGDVPIVGLLPGDAVREIERDDHLVVEELWVALAVLDGFNDGMQKLLGGIGVDPNAQIR